MLYNENMTSLDLSGKVALVTGAGRGIGKAIALAFARAGATVVVNYHRSEKEAAAVVKDILAAGGVARAHRADVSNEKEVDALFAKVRTEHGTLDILVNNAGVMKNNLLLMTSAEEFDEMMATNARGTFLCTRAALKMMRKQRSGKIINIASIVGQCGNRGQAAYAASKAAIIGLTRSAAKEAGAFGVTVNAIAPGIIDTALMRSTTPEPVATDLLSHIALGRFGTPEDVAGVALFLASPLADYVSGEVLGVDGCETL